MDPFPLDAPPVGVTEPCTGPPTASSRRSVRGVTPPERTEPPWQPHDPWFVYLGERQELLRSDAAAVTRYCVDHPEVWGGVWMDDDARLLVGLTVLDPHAAKVAALLEHPQDVDIVAVARTAAEVEAVWVDVRAVMAEQRSARAPGQRSLFSVAGIRGRRVHVELHPTGEALARQLHTRHGDALDLHVGALPYPLDPQALPGPVRGPLPTAAWAELQLTARPDTTIVQPGDDVTGLMTITNTGRSPIRITGGQPLPAQLVDADGHLAGTHTGFTAGTGFRAVLADGESQQVRFVGGTAGATTYLTPPGRYDLVVLLDLNEGPHRGQLLTPPVPIDVRPAPPGP